MKVQIINVIFYNIKIFLLVQGFDNSIDKYYNNTLLEKVIMQINKKIMENIFSKFIW